MAPPAPALCPAECAQAVSNNTKRVAKRFLGSLQKCCVSVEIVIANQITSAILTQAGRGQPARSEAARAPFSHCRKQARCIFLAWDGSCVRWKSGAGVGWVGGWGRLFGEAAVQHRHLRNIAQGCAGKERMGLWAFRGASLRAARRQPV
eukprot:364938-Chlamydomonas_euryale.AAC.18